MSSDEGGGKAEAEAPKKKSKKMLIIIVAVVALLLAGAGGVFMFVGGGSSKKSAATAKPSPVPGGVVQVTAVTVNLADSHYLKVQLAVQVAAGVPSDEDTSDWADLTIAEFSNKTVAELSTPEGREKAKEDLLKKMQKQDPNKVLELYFTQFVMQ